MEKNVSTTAASLISYHALPPSSPPTQNRVSCEVEEIHSFDSSPFGGLGSCHVVRTPSFP